MTAPIRTRRRSRCCRATRLTAGFIVALTVLDGCGAADPSESSDSAVDNSTSAPSVNAPIAPPAVPGIRAVAVRLRTDVPVGGQFQTRITNTGPEPFSVLAVSLDSPGFQRMPFAGRAAVYNPGATIDLPTGYGPPVCDDGVAVDPLFTVLQVQRPGGQPEEVRVPLEAVDDIVDRIHHEECHALALDAAVEVSLGGDFSTTGVDASMVVPATITLTRGNSIEEIALTELRGSVVLYVLFAGESEPPPTMPADENELTVPIEITITGRTCDAHVLSETKQPFLFPFFLTFDGGEPQYGTLDVSPEQQDSLWSYIRAVCAIG